MQPKDTLSFFVVDDDAFCRNLYEQHLHSMGHLRVRTFSDGQECLNHLTEQPDIIFLDYNMEPMNGLDVLKKIKRFNPDIFLVIVSGQEDMQVAINALKYGAFDYIIKGESELEMINRVLAKIQHVTALLRQRPTTRWRKLLTNLKSA